MTTLFVYGTLMRGESNHALLARARFVGERSTESSYTLVDLGHFPAMLDGGGTAVRGEIYDVDAETLAAVDRLEGHPTFYARRRLALAGGELAEAYFLPSRHGRRPRIECGDWRAHRITLVGAAIDALDRL